MFMLRGSSQKKKDGGSGDALLVRSWADFFLLIRASFGLAPEWDSFRLPWGLMTQLAVGSRLRIIGLVNLRDGLCAWPSWNMVRNTLCGGRGYRGGREEGGEERKKSTMMLCNRNVALGEQAQLKYNVCTW